MSADRPQRRATHGRSGRGAARGRDRFRSTVGLVALVVAMVILVFFALGYLFGRLYL